ncbi:MAG: hypothetical protein HFJ06_08120 [Lachnospiraceae bacterium]|nr:hypothetical protein [Lachnospiraceae bacterium]
MGIAGIGADIGSWKDAFYGIPKAGKEAADNNKEGEYTKEEMLQIISDRMEEIYEKVKNNDTETSFQIGSQSFTIKEWNRILEQFDAVQEEIREQMREEQAKQQKETTTKVSVEAAASVTSKDSTNLAKAAGIITSEPSKGDVGNTDNESVMDSLVTESTTCTYPASGEKDSDEMYITWYTEDGIFCRKAGQTEGYFWSVSYENAAQYDRVMNFLSRIKADADYHFAAHENFWRDFLEDKVDEDDFAGFLNGLEKNAAKKEKYAEYMN